jgi:hypothetical protein
MRLLLILIKYKKPVSARTGRPSNLPREVKNSKSEWEKKKRGLFTKSFHNKRERERELTPDVGISH